MKSLDLDSPGTLRSALNDYFEKLQAQKRHERECPNEHCSDRGGLFGYAEGGAADL